jgi:hypothetical protein
MFEIPGGLPSADIVEKLAALAAHPPILIFRAEYQRVSAPRLGAGSQFMPLSCGNDAI